MDETYLSTVSFAEKHGVSSSTVLKWIREGRVPGAKKFPQKSSCKGYVYLIPEDAVLSKPKRGRPASMCSTPEAAPPKREYTRREISLFIRRHCGTMTYGQIAATLGMTTLEVRAVYDWLHKRYHI